MILSGKEILKRIGKGIEIEPFDEKFLDPCCWLRGVCDFTYQCMAVKVRFRSS